MRSIAAMMSLNFLSEGKFSPRHMELKPWLIEGSLAASRLSVATCTLYMYIQVGYSQSVGALPFTIALNLTEKAEASFQIISTKVLT